MSYCSFQAQLVSIMDILAKAAVAEINRRVDDSCAVIKVELRRSRRDIDSLKRKCVMMENELKRVKGRGRTRVWVSGTSEIRYPATLRTECVRDADAVRSQDENPEQIHNILQDVQVLDDDLGGPVIKEERCEEEPGSTGVWVSGTSEIRYPATLRTECVRDADAIRSQDQNPEQIHNILQDVQVLDDDLGGPVIKEERCEEEPGSTGGAVNIPFEDPEDQNVQHVQTQENIESQNALFGDPEGQRTHFTDAHTCTEPPEPVKLNEESLGLQVKVEKDTEEEESLTTERFESSVSSDHPRYPLWPSVSEPTHDTDRTSSTSQRLQNPAMFSHLNAAEPPRNNLPPVEATQMELYRSRQVSAENQNRPVWCGDSTQELVHVTHSDRLSSAGAVYTQQHQRMLPTAVNMLHKPNTPTNAFSVPGGRGALGAIHQQRTHWRSSRHIVKQFSCSFCEKCFNRLSEMKEHMRCHTGEKPFTCTQCGRSFTKHYNLIRHAMVHSGEKPYQCTLCGRRFTQRSTLKSHEKTHRGDWGTAHR